MIKARRQSAAIFLGFFALYLWTSPPTLSPYRDAGEMSVAAWSLGVAHPPSYPLYVLLGHAAELLPLGTPAYRLAAFSALAGAGALAALCLGLSRTLGPWPAAAAAALLGLSPTFWGVCQVQEMYSLTVFLAAILLLMGDRLREAYRTRLFLAFAFFYGLSLGNRTDLLLWAPGLLVLALPRAPARRDLIAGLLLGALGLSVYLYLPIRSFRGPWLDWNHPADLGNLIGSLTRRGYGGTLDLLSKSYAPGENFLSGLRELARHLWGGFGLALAPAFAGAWMAARADRRRGLGLALLYAASGPLFIYLANLPPNPHALAIVEPHYLLSDLVIALWAAEGLAALAPWARPLAAGLILLQAGWSGRWPRMDRRDNLVGYDYALNAMRSAPPGAVLVAKKDVQIFSLWYYQRAQGLRPDLRLVAQGLAHSPWYQASQRRAGTALSLGPLRSADDWAAFLSKNAPVYATMDAELPSAGGSSRGLLASLSAAPAPPADWIWELLPRRGDYRYELRPDFFTADLVEGTAQALERMGASGVSAQERSGASHRALLAAWSMKGMFPEPLAFLGYAAFSLGDLAAAEGYYLLAVKAYDETLAFSREYNALPDVRRSIGRSAAETCLNLGVVYEKLKRPAEAERAYLKALEADPGSAKARFNVAVLYWNKDWRRVASELEEALRIDPNNAQALRFLPMARAKAGK